MKVLLVLLLVFSFNLTLQSAQRFGEYKRVKEVSANYTLKSIEDTILVDATGADRTITLPLSTSSNVKGKVWTIVKVDNSSNKVIIQRSGSDVINSSYTKVNLLNQNDKVEIFSYSTGNFFAKENIAFTSLKSFGSFHFTTNFTSGNGSGYMSNASGSGDIIGSIETRVACDDDGASQGSTCSTSNEMMGFEFNVDELATYKVCGYVSVYYTGSVYWYGFMHLYYSDTGLEANLADKARTYYADGMTGGNRGGDITVCFSVEPATTGWKQVRFWRSTSSNTTATHYVPYFEVTKYKHSEKKFPFE